MPSEEEGMRGRQGIIGRGVGPAYFDVTTLPTKSAPNRKLRRSYKKEMTGKA